MDFDPTLKSIFNSVFVFYKIFLASPDYPLALQSGICVVF
jgi:hypothetical protein